MSDVRYTLDEARRELARRECVALGHDWVVVTGGGGEPRLVLCERCGASRRVEP